MNKYSVLIVGGGYGSDVVKPAGSFPVTENQAL